MEGYTVQYKNSNFAKQRILLDGKNLITASLKIAS